MRKTKELLKAVAPRKDHKTERRERSIRESYCAEPRCKFKGKLAEQGICFSTEPFAGGSDWSYLDRAEKYGQTALDETRALWLPGKANNRNGGWRGYAKYLESCHYTYWVQEVFHLDEMIRLRRRVALMEASKASAPTAPLDGDRPKANQDQESELKP